MSKSYGKCCDCGKDLPGIQASRFVKPRRCMACYRKTCKGWHLNQGYVRVTVVPGRKGKRRYAHQIEAEKIIGRPLMPGEVVHHRNEHRSDNVGGNLKVHANAGVHVLAEGHVSRGVDGKFQSPKERK